MRVFYVCVYRPVSQRGACPESSPVCCKLLLFDALHCKQLRNAVYYLVVCHLPCMHISTGINPLALSLSVYHLSPFLSYLAILLQAASYPVCSEPVLCCLRRSSPRPFPLWQLWGAFKYTFCYQYLPFLAMEGEKMTIAAETLISSSCVYMIYMELSKREPYWLFFSFFF